MRSARVVILRSCNYPTAVASEVRRRNAIRIGELLNYERGVMSRSPFLQNPPEGLSEPLAVPKSQPIRRAGF